MRRTVPVALLWLALAACATRPVRPEPFDTADPIPEYVPPQEVSEPGLVQLLVTGVPGMTEQNASRLSAEAFRRPPNTLVAVHDEHLAYDALVRATPTKRYALVLHTSAEGYPVLPVERLAKAIFLNGVTPEAQHRFSTQLAQCLASNGRCTTLVRFDNGNAMAITAEVDRNNPVSLTTDAHFFKAGAFSPQDYMLVVSGGSAGVVCTGTTGTALHKVLDVLELPRQGKLNGGKSKFEPPKGGDL